MKLKAVGHRVIVKPDEREEVTKGGIVLPSKDKKREEAAQHRGTLVGVGPQAWKEFSDGQPWAEVGDKVYFVKHGGQIIEDEDTGEFYRVLNDDEIVVKVAV